MYSTYGVPCRAIPSPTLPTALWKNFSPKIHRGYQVPFSYHDAESIETSLRNAGFTETRSELLQITTTAEPHEDFARGLVFGNPLEEEILDRGADPQAVHAAITRALKRDLPEPMPLQALVIEARLGG